MSTPSKDAITIKKYANRRLYNTATSTYVTLADLSQMVKEGVEFNVYDAKSGEDLTRAVLTQIIVEEEGKTGQNLLPISFLRQLISFYGDNMQWMVPKYLEQSMQALSKNQEQIRSYFKNTFGTVFPFGNTLEAMSKQNMALFEQTMRMFSPFGNVPGQAPVAPAAHTVSEPSAEDVAEQAAEGAFTPSVAMPTPATQQASQTAPGGEDVQNKIAALQRQLADLAKR
ncbi:MAG: polyhydroxyalkanoate synthesis repressor PhaR [Alphaproteobacteria bacterium]|nr:polyhydroxyalkanoate synthesis repressor PhaR [Alphaproteobacteria bacterium]MBV8548265.1 polyhydroxyalkanoate synthesis repressor PhaR [Alphaproteobacteria bacterium]